MNTSLLFVFLMLLHCCSSSSSDKECSCNENKYTAEANIPKLSNEEMYKRGHLKPFGSHRPPMDVETLKYMIAPEDFYMQFVVKHKPVVIKGVTQSWPAHHLWTDEYLEEKYGESKMNMETKDDDKYNIPPSKKFKDFLKVYKTAKSNLYLVDEVTPEMREEVKMPLCLQCEEIDRFFFVSYYWHSNGGTMSTVHIDTDENLLCVIRGHKKVIMVSPVYSHDLYTDSANQMGVLDLNSSAVNFDKYPNVMNIHHYETMVDEGDCVYIPQMWWHQVYSRKERQQAVAMWWKSKPFWKRVSKEEALISESIPQDKQRKHSYADSLVDYEHWVLNATKSIPRIKCKEQNVKMSKYSWETDKTEENSQTLGDGGDLEEEVFDEVEVVNKTNSVEQVKEANEEAKKVRGPGCDFDRTNKKSPCYLRFDDDDDLKYIRYVMDYCKHFEDRGCVITKPQILNKMMNEEFQTMAYTIKSKFKA